MQFSMGTKMFCNLAISGFGVTPMLNYIGAKKMILYT